MPSKAAELRELPDEELYVRIESAKEELFSLATVRREREIELELDSIAAAAEAAEEEDQP